MSDSDATHMDSSDQPESGNTPPDRAEFLIVGLGASAGGLEALEEFFDEIPDDSGMAFVVITHLAPGRVSLLPELIARHCRIPVVRIEEGTELVPNQVYVQPAGVTVGLLHGKLHLFEPAEDGPRPLPIDFFFRCLAQDHKERAVGIVLSGTGSDGTNGLKEIKAVSGLTMAQDEQTARYAGMPHSANAAVALDYVLPPREIARELIHYARGPAKRVLGARNEPVEFAEIMSRIFVLLRNRTGHDFSHYKATTTGRRIARRMNAHQIEAPKDYLRYVQVNPQELDLLFRELLIGVTSFFRDAEAFESLVQLGFRSILNDKPDGYVVRCWVAGCSTGEEAYSIAMLLREFMDQASMHVGVQIFATDLDPESVDHARSAVYPQSITSDVNPKRLERFFIEEDGHYRIRKEIREMVVFATQDVVEDPPFTKLDLLVCRNLLIYLNAEIQKRLIPIFHYSLKPGGILFLGSSETIGSAAALFEPLDKKWKLFKRREVPVGTYVAEVPLAFGIDPVGRDSVTMPTVRRAEAGLSHTVERALLQHLVPPTVIMHQTGDIVHIQGRTGQYLEPASGPQGSANIYTMAREGLQLELTLAVRQAASTLGEVVHRGVRVRTNGDFTRVDLRVKQLMAPDALRGLFLVSFIDSQPEGTQGPRAEGGANAEPERVQELERELVQAKEVHQTTIEELETANEELKSANEELQSMNEELQSANEELETSKEEMQSLNEELQTVNVELQGKVEELSRANDDMKNLLNATDIATIFLDNKLNIKRYTEQAKRVIRLIPSDISRPIGDLVSNLRYTTLVEDAREVLRTLVFKETEIQGEDGSWYLMRILPYRTTENMIDGLVVTFVNVTKVRGLLDQTRRLLSALSSSSTGVCAQDRELRYEWAFGSIFGRWPNEVNGRTDRELLRDEEAETLVQLKRSVLESGRPTHERVRLSIQGQTKIYDVVLTPVREDERIVGVASVVMELTGEGRN